MATQALITPCNKKLKFMRKVNLKEEKAEGAQQTAGGGMHLITCVIDQNDSRGDH